MAHPNAAGDAPGDAPTDTRRPALPRVEITNVRKSGKTWVVEACVDVSGLKTVDKNGKSVTGPPYRILHKSTVKRGSKHLVIVKDEAVTEC